MELAKESRVSRVGAEALRGERELLNTKFAEYRASGHAIDADALLDHIADQIDPILCAVAESLPERVRTTLIDLFGCSLELFAASLLGPMSKVEEINNVWQRLFPIIPRLLARDPARVVASLCNATYNLANQTGARPGEWVERMAAVAPRCGDIEQLLACGRILAWQSGMVQYRSDALNSARTINSELASACLQMPADTPSQSLQQALDRMESDPWLRPANALENHNSAAPISIVDKVGDFRGLGGEFLRPPIICLTTQGFRVTDGHGQWDLLADRFGWLLSRTNNSPGPATAPQPTPSVAANGKVQWDAQTAEFPVLVGASSYAFDGKTLAVTLPTSHHVYLLAHA